MFFKQCNQGKYQSHVFVCVLTSTAPQVSIHSRANPGRYSHCAKNYNFHNHHHMRSKGWMNTITYRVPSSPSSLV